MKKEPKLPGDYDPFRIPAYNPGAAFKISSLYGYREDPIETSRLTREPNQKKKPEFHSGQDYAALAGTPIPSAASGAVVYSGFSLWGIIRCGLRSSRPMIDRHPKTMSCISAGGGGWMPEQARYRLSRQCPR
jgi:hypothetical protein